MIKYIGCSILFSLSLYGSIFNGDDRVEYFEMPATIKSISESSISLIPKYKLKRIGNQYKLESKSLHDQYDFCKDARFSSQPMGANCSGILIKGDYLLTAAHCISKSMKGYGIDDFYAVFNYKKQSKNKKDYYFSEDEVFELKKEIHYEFDNHYRSSFLDLAIFQLASKPRFPSAKLSFQKTLKEDRVYTLGYPLGVPLKLSDDSVVTKVMETKNSFRHELDTFSVNSGSPIFNSHHEVIGVHVRGTGSNFKANGRSCNDWLVGEPGKDFGEANNILSLEKVYSGLNP